MKFWERIGIGIMSCWGLYAIHEGVNSLVRVHNWQAMTISDWGTWVGAIGTIGAIAGSIYLATAENRNRERDSRLIAEIHAEAMLIRVISLRASTVPLAEAAIRYAEAAINKDILNWCVSYIYDLETWSIEELAPITPMSKSAVVNLARASGLLDVIRLAYSEKLLATRRPEPKEEMNDLHTLLANLDRYLSAAETELKTNRKFIKRS